MGRTNQGSGRGQKSRWNSSNSKSSKSNTKKAPKKEYKFQTLEAHSKHQGVVYATFDELRDELCIQLAVKNLDSPNDIIDTVRELKLKD
jgi:hypothetical protein